MPETASSIGDLAQAILATPDAGTKAALSHRAAARWRAGEVRPGVATKALADRPARAPRPRLLPPRDMPKRSAGTSRKGRVALLHALAHIELNAIDLAWDMVARFAGPDSSAEFLDDWIGVADDESRHFELLCARLADLGASYGDLPAHDGLWQAARDTRHDILARLAVVPMVLEARGLDITPSMIVRFRRNGDTASSDILALILTDEIRHVAVGARWFHNICRDRGLDPAETFHDLVPRYFRSPLKPPFNQLARSSAGMPPDFYLPLVNPDRNKSRPDPP